MDYRFLWITSKNILKQVWFGKHKLLQSVKRGRSSNNPSKQGLLDLTTTNDVISNLTRLMLISIDHHTADLSDIFISCCVITTQSNYRLTTIYSGV